LTGLAGEQDGDASASSLFPAAAIKSGILARAYIAAHLNGINGGDRE
jgi:hypothetical protein